MNHIKALVLFSLVIIAKITSVAQASWPPQIWPHGNPYSHQCNEEEVFIEGIPGCNSHSYTLVFEDNFDGTVLDFEKWEIQPWHVGSLYNSGNVGSQEYNSFDNVVISDGTCKIIAKKEAVTRRAIPYLSDSTIVDDGLTNLRPYNYTSSSLFSIRKFHYGKYEIRCKLPWGGKGFWPAFWAYGGPRWNELDIFDDKDGPDILSCGSGYDFNNDGNSFGCRGSVNNVPDPTQWHTYTCIFDADKIIWKIDNSTVRTVYRYSTILGQDIDCSTEITPYIYFRKKSWPIDEDMSIIMNLAILKGNEAPSDDKFPGIYEIDYVRFWKKNDAPCTGCLDNITFENINQLPNSTRATNYIVAGNDTKVLSGQEVKFKSPEINLQPGFSAELGGDFSAIPEACNILTYQEVPINYIGNNAINGYEIDRCADPIYSIDVTGALYYSFQVRTSPNLNGIILYSTSGAITSSHIDLWNSSIFGGNGAFYTRLLLFSCNDLVQESKVIFVTSPGCRLADTTSGSSNDSLARIIQSEPEIPVLNKEFLIYPNPVKDQLNVFYTVNQVKPIMLIINDASGKILFEKKFESVLGANRVSIDTNPYANGTYFMKIISGDEKKESKFIIAK